MGLRNRCPWCLQYLNLALGACTICPICLKTWTISLTLLVDAFTFCCLGHLLRRCCLDHYLEMFSFFQIVLSLISPVMVSASFMFQQINFVLFRKKDSHLENLKTPNLICLEFICFIILLRLVPTYLRLSFLCCRLVSCAHHLWFISLVHSLNV